jgi:hypothetical protein
LGELYRESLYEPTKHSVIVRKEKSVPTRLIHFDSIFEIKYTYFEGGVPCESLEAGDEVLEAEG